MFPDPQIGRSTQHLMGGGEFFCYSVFSHNLWSLFFIECVLLLPPFSWFNAFLSGCRYYHNRVTKLSSWEKPTELMTPTEVSFCVWKKSALQLTWCCRSYKIWLEKRAKSSVKVFQLECRHTDYCASIWKARITFEMIMMIWTCFCNSEQMHQLFGRNSPLQMVESKSSRVYLW